MLCSTIWSFGLFSCDGREEADFEGGGEGGQDQEGNQGGTRRYRIK